MVTSHKFSPQYQEIFGDLDPKKFETSAQIMKKYPGFKNIPKDSVCFTTPYGGIVKAKDTLATVRKLLEHKYGADLKWSTTVAKVTSDSVTTEAGEVCTADHVVVATGTFTLDSFDKGNKSARKMEVEMLTFNDGRGLPAAHVELCEDGGRFYGAQDGEDLEEYKIGVYGERDIDKLVNHIKLRLPEKVENLSHASICSWTMIKGGDFQYKTNKDGVHFVYGFSGQGFKFLPLHGKIVYEGLLYKIEQKFIPDQFRAKI